jgi:hypothetical protein
MSEIFPKRDCNILFPDSSLGLSFSEKNRRKEKRFCSKKLKWNKKRISETGE